MRRSPPPPPGSNTTTPACRPRWPLTRGRTLVDYLHDAARERPDRPGALFKGSTLTWVSWNGDRRRRVGVRGARHRRGDRVALLLPNCPQFVIAQFGAWKIGAIVAPINPTYTERELEGPLNDHQIATIVTLTRS